MLNIQAGSGSVIGQSCLIYWCSPFWIICIPYFTTILNVWLPANTNIFLRDDSGLICILYTYFKRCFKSGTRRRGFKFDKSLLIRKFLKSCNIAHAKVHLHPPNTLILFFVIKSSTNDESSQKAQAVCGTPKGWFVWKMKRIGSKL